MKIKANSEYNITLLKSFEFEQYKVTVEQYTCDIYEDTFFIVKDHCTNKTWLYHNQEAAIHRFEVQSSKYNNA